MDFPTMVYRSPGPHFGAAGKTYAYQAVRNSAELAAAVAQGWTLSFAEAMGIAQVAAETDRDDLIAKAAALGIKIDKRWGDDRLAAEIEKAKA